MAFDPISAISGLVSTIVGKIFPDANKKLDVQEAKDAAVAAIKEMKVTGELDQVMAQLQVNLAEAQSHNIFIAGWRPFVGWVCGSAFAWSFVVCPLMTWIVEAFGYKLAGPIPVLDLTTMMPVLLGMLGMGGFRTFEKYTGAEGSRS
jgi:hypothetical protein